jgi:hypothetical protein
MYSENDARLVATDLIAASVMAAAFRAGQDSAGGH